MLKVVSVEQMREIEAAIDASVMSYDQMMLNAGRAAAHYLLNQLDITSQTRITLLIGKGNNGGDGLVVAHHLAQHTDAEIRLYLLEARSDDDPNFQAVKEDNLLITTSTDDHDNRMLKNLINSADIIIDALFGIGIHLPLREDVARILRTVNQQITTKYETYQDTVTVDPAKPAQLSVIPLPYVFAIDCPSGVDCNTGKADVNTITATETITFIAAKPGLFTFPAAKYVGNLVLSQIGIPDTTPTINEQNHFVIDNHFVKTHLPDRPIDGHKGTFGKTYIVAGSKNYIGATALSGESAYRSGAGLVTIATTTQNIRIIAGQLREPTFIHLPDTDSAINTHAVQTVLDSITGYSALLVGCGLGQHPETQKFVNNLLDHKDLPPLVIDADALNILSKQKNWWEKLPTNTIITPHPGEMARLVDTTTEDIHENRWKLASEKAQEWNVVLVFKGAHTLIASPDGRIAVVPFKSDALGTAGTGDVLAGLIAGLRTQNHPAFESAVVGAYIHALAGTIAKENIGNSRSVIARDVLNNLGQAFHQIENS